MPFMESFENEGIHEPLIYLVTPFGQNSGRRMAHDGVFFCAEPMGQHD